MTESLFIGLMSGTSADGIDAVLIAHEGHKIKVIASDHQLLAPSLRKEILAFRQPGENELHRAATLDSLLADAYANSVHSLLFTARVSPADIVAIGQHGQTLRHYPDGETPYTVQVGDPNRLAELTGITVVADFRRRDIAAGGQGAPLVPAFHRAQFATPGVATAIVNIGGIANVSLVLAEGSVTGWDTGPGNTLMDAWIACHQDAAFDQAGAWAATGAVIPELLEGLLKTPYFGRAAPKSTGPEAFHLEWLRRYLSGSESSADVQRTLLELTVESIAQALEISPPATVRICGGGANNTFLMARLSERLSPAIVTTTEVVGIPPSWVEAAAFAWLAAQAMAGTPGNVPAVTGAMAERVLGGIYSGH
jgi:anhydro-N-acetylmuramic acid kinase